MNLRNLPTRLSTTYPAVSKRTTEIATLRAIGFCAPSVVASVFAEPLIVAVVGAAVGVAVACFCFNGNSVSAVSGSSASQLTYVLVVTPQLIAIGAIGGLLPALGAAILPVAATMRIV